MLYITIVCIFGRFVCVLTINIFFPLKNIVMFSLLAKLEAGIAFSHLITYKYNIKSIILNKNNIQSRHSIDIIHSFYLIKDMEYRLKLHPTFVN